LLRYQLRADGTEFAPHLPQRDERQHGLGILTRPKRSMLVGGGNRRREKSCKSVTMPSTR